VYETTTAGIPIQSPQLDINTVAAGGGSRLAFRNGLFTAGPESAGAVPGPACYRLVILAILYCSSFNSYPCVPRNRRGGPLAVTDANLLLGRLLPDYFPKIFGKNENEGLDIEASKRAFEAVAAEINANSDKQLSLDEIAYG
jgi:5-oxoprolinase (ATP-hydrolysing)